MSQPTFAKEILDLAVAIEHECAGVYEVFARQFSEDEDLACFWRLYAEAERYHGASIRIHQVTFADPVDGDAFPGEATESRAFLERLRQMRVQYDAARPTLVEAFAAAKEIESATAELHGRTQFFKLYPRFQELFARMVAEDESHRNMLAEAEARFVQG
jgi:hypothetical protein